MLQNRLHSLYPSSSLADEAISSRVQPASQASIIDRRDVFFFCSNRWKLFGINSKRSRNVDACEAFFCDRRRVGAVRGVKGCVCVERSLTNQLDRQMFDEVAHPR